MSLRQPAFRALLLASALLAPIAPVGLGRAEPSTKAQAGREIEIVVDGSYKPARIEIHKGELVRPKFLRKDSNSCTKEVVFPALNLRKALPPNEPVRIDLPTLSAGEYDFKCGMNMIRGTIVVSGHHHHG